jgi:hypothetical protein
MLVKFYGLQGQADMSVKFCGTWGFRQRRTEKQGIRKMYQKALVRNFQTQ